MGTHRLGYLAAAAWHSTHPLRVLKMRITAHL
jgi:hypothetical protein